MAPKPKSKKLLYLDEVGKKVLKRSDLSGIYQKLYERHELPEYASFPNFLRKLLKEGNIQVVQLAFPKRNEKRYLRNNPTEYALALSLRNNSYLSHESAAFLLGLVSGLPSQIYLNYEQTPKPQSAGVLTQERIDLAFKNEARKSKTTAKYQDFLIHVINGMYTGQLGVIDFKWGRDEKLRITNIERTLIDLAVRPIYAGGVKQIIEIYKRATAELSLSRITEYLEKLRYIYPFHQAIGFYLERTGAFSDEDLAILKDRGMQFDFYLTHHMKNIEYSPKWRIYYPGEITHP